MFQQGNVRRRARPAVGLDHDLTFQGVAPLLATVIGVPVVRVARTLHRLFQAVHHHTQFRDHVQQFRELPPTFATRIRQSHHVPSRLFRQRVHPRQRARYVRGADAKQVAQDINGWVQVQPDHYQQQMVTQLQHIAASGSDVPLPVRALQACLFRFDVARQQVPHPVVKSRNGQSGQFQKGLGIEEQ